MIGKTISHYKILEKLGEGGMGVVYKAEDTKLDRIVALKFLPRHIVANEEDRIRFGREAKAAAALNHPNITTIYTVGEVDSEPFIVMEYIEGQELKETVGESGRSSLAIGIILDYAAQIAEGVQAAHEKGIIHRDIKSANIMITEKVHVKIMDFGLAKVSGEAQLTKEHSTLGTAAYMSPEQALGEDIDHRTDIWTFGVVLYEMLTGLVPFQGKSDSAIIQSILNNEPQSIADKRANVPFEIQQITYKCLQKNRERRYQTFEGLLFDLTKAGTAPDYRKSKPKTGKQWKKIKGPATAISIVAAPILIVLFAIIAISSFREKQKNPKIVNTRSLFSTTAELRGDPEISPDGTRVAQSSNKNGNVDVCVEQLASGQRLNLTKNYEGIDGGPTWSPDGEWLAFLSTRDGGGIFVVSAYGGNVRQVLSHSMDDIGFVRWSPDGENLSYNLLGKVYYMPAQGGTPREINLPHSVRFGPTWAPDSHRFTYVAHQKIWSVGLDDSRPTVVVDKRGIYYCAPIWSHDGKRIYFKWKRGEIRDIWWVEVDELGRPKDKVRPLTSGRDIFSFSFSNDGRKLVYTSGEYQHNIHALPITTDRVLSMDDAQQITHNKWYINPSANFLTMSPDFERISLMAERSGNYQIYVVDKDGKNLKSVTADSSDKSGARWAPDGEHIVFSGDGDIYTISTKGGALTPIVSDTSRNMYPVCSPDGKQIVFTSNRSGNPDLWVMPFKGGVAQQLTTDAAEEYEPIWSPAGDMISFGSNRNGAHDIYLVEIESRTIKKLTSINSPDYIGHAWSLDGKKIYMSYRPKADEFSRNICEVTLRDNTIHTLLESRNLSLQNRLQRALASDGENVYFVKEHYNSGTWIADVIYE